jgi:ribokinase
MKRPKIMIIGSLNMDLVVTMERMPQIGETIQGQNIHYISGGKGANQAVGCAKLGANITMVGAVGTDLFGHQIINQLNEYKVTTDKIAQIDSLPTGTATILHTSKDNSIVIVPGANSACTVEMASQYETDIGQSDLLLLQLEIPLPTVQHALTIARSYGVKTVLNPAPAQALSPELLNLVDIITPNETEFALLSGQAYSSEEELANGLRLWQKTYHNTVIVTRGEQGCSYIDPTIDEFRTIPTASVHVVDTTGAGDAFNAALCYGISTGQSLEQAISFALKAATLSVTQFGAQNGMPTYAEVMSFIALR